MVPTSPSILSHILMMMLDGSKLLMSTTMEANKLFNGLVFNIPLILLFLSSLPIANIILLLFRLPFSTDGGIMLMKPKDLN